MLVLPAVAYPLYLAVFGTGTGILILTRRGYRFRRPQTAAGRGWLVDARSLVRLAAAAAAVAVLVAVGARIYRITSAPDQGRPASRTESVQAWHLVNPAPPARPARRHGHRYRLALHGGPGGGASLSAAPAAPVPAPSTPSPARQRSGPMPWPPPSSPPPYSPPSSSWPPPEPSPGPSATAPARGPSRAVNLALPAALEGWSPVSFHHDTRSGPRLVSCQAPSSLYHLTMERVKQSVDPVSGDDGDWVSPSGSASIPGQACRSICSLFIRWSMP